MASYKIPGKIYWCKLLGNPEPGYDETKLEWSTDFAVNADIKNQIERLGLGAKIRNKGGDRGDYLSFTRPLKKTAPNKDGKIENEPVRVIDKDGNTWDNNRKIGNGSEGILTFGIYDVPPSKKFKGGPKPVIYELQVTHYVAPPVKETFDFTAGPEGDKPNANQQENFAG